MNVINLRSKPAIVGAVTAASLVPMLASAATLPLPTADVLAYVAACVAFITVVGGAVLGMIYLAKGIRWARKAG